MMKLFTLIAISTLSFGCYGGEIDLPSSDNSNDDNFQPQIKHDNDGVVISCKETYLKHEIVLADGVKKIIYTLLPCTNKIGDPYSPPDPESEFDPKKRNPINVGMNQDLTIPF